MNIVVKKVGKNPVRHEISNNVITGLQELQQIVGGHIQVVPYEDFLLVCNEDGKLRRLAPNFFYGMDIIVGDVAFVGQNCENFASLTLAQQNFLLTKFTAKER